MAGEYDDKLKWPYVGKVSVDLLNWRENKGHHRMTLSVDVSNGVGRVKVALHRKQEAVNIIHIFMQLPFLFPQYF